MADAMLKKTPQQKAGSAAQAIVIGDSAHNENLNPSITKGKGKAPAPKSGSSSNTHQKNMSHMALQKVNAEMRSTSTGDATPAGPSPAAIHAEALAILCEMHNNQYKTNEKVERLALKFDELYKFDYITLSQLRTCKTLHYMKNHRTLAVTMVILLFT